MRNDMAAPEPAIADESRIDASGGRRGAERKPGAAGTRNLDALEFRAWTAFLRAHARVTRRLEADLMSVSNLPLAEYDVLVQLATAEGRQLRMHELADRVILSRAGITRLVDRLVADGLVERAKCGLDARGSYAVLTAAGLARLRAASPGHLASVRRDFLDAFSRSELERLAELLERTIDE
jgi:DNA-binding MarR family transcriptional regulator